MLEIRLQKVIADAGFCSRREAERMIRAGRVQVNGTVETIMGTRVDPTTTVIAIDGKPLDLTRPETIVLCMNKPQGLVCTANDPEGRRTVFSILPPDLPRLFTIGRLDFYTEGLLLFTNDGDLANALTHPSTGVLREYEAKVKGHPNRKEIQKVAAGCKDEKGRMMKPIEVSFVRRTRKNCWYRMILGEGRYHEVRLLFDHGGLEVVRLARVSFGPIELHDLPLGASRMLSLDEIRKLRALGNPEGTPRRHTGRNIGHGPPLPNPDGD
jgi:23S rRNA pseudouridine2605 synthase